MAIGQKPSAYDLWVRAGGGTDAYDRAEYLRLMREAELIRDLQPGETREPLPCGWPDRRVSETEAPDA